MNSSFSPRHTIDNIDYTYRPIHTYGNEIHEYSKRPNCYLRKHCDIRNNDTISFNKSLKANSNNHNYYINIRKRYQSKEKQYIKLVEPCSTSITNTYHKLQTPKTAHTFIIDPADRNTFRNKYISLKYTDSRNNNINNNNNYNSNRKSINSIQRPKTSEHKCNLTDISSSLRKSEEHPLKKQIKVIKDKIHKLNEELHDNKKSYNVNNDGYKNSNIGKEMGLSLYETSYINKLNQVEKEKCELSAKVKQLQIENEKLRNQLVNAVNKNINTTNERDWNDYDDDIKEKDNNWNNNVIVHEQDILINKSYSSLTKRKNYKDTDELIMVIEEENEVLCDTIQELENQINLIFRLNAK
jgi:hypothetical protein